MGLLLYYHYLGGGGGGDYRNLTVVNNMQPNGSYFSICMCFTHDRQGVQFVRSVEFPGLVSERRKVQRLVFQWLPSNIILLLVLRKKPVPGIALVDIRQEIWRNFAALC